jgi:flavin reductase
MMTQNQTFNGATIDGDPAHFRAAMRRLTSTVSIVSTAENGGRYGLTITSVSSVSMKPPSLLFCVNAASSLHDPLIRSGEFCVNLLMADQDDIAVAFSSAGLGNERFQVGEWGQHENVPFLMRAQANIFCDLDAISSYGTHSIMVGKVRNVAVMGDVSPLLYEDGNFTRSEISSRNHIEHLARAAG